MNIIIFGNADIDDYSYVEDYVKKSDFIICCDGGIRHTLAMQIKPNIIIGDFDSAEIENMNYYMELDIKVKKYPDKKDETDMEICLMYAIEHGAENITIFGGIGSRFDHSLANVMLLKIGLEERINVSIVNANNKIQMIDKEIKLQGNIGDFVSLIPMIEDVDVVLTEGLSYPLKNEKILFGHSRGISNEFCEKEAYIKINNGILLVVQAKD